MNQRLGNTGNKSTVTLGVRVKPIPSYNFGAVLFLSELGLQCHLFNRSIQRLERAADHWKKLILGIDDGETAPPLEIAADCTVCLSAMAAVRRILRPSRSARVAVKRRSEALLNLLGNPALHNVTSVKVRNSWEHLDERLDDILSMRVPGQGSVSELHVSPKPPDARTIVMRRFDPTEFTIHFANDAISLIPCVDEMKELSGLIDNAYVRLQTERVNV